MVMGWKAEYLSTVDLIGVPNIFQFKFIVFLQKEPASPPRETSAG